MTTPDTPVSSGSVVAVVFAMKGFGLRNPLKGEHHVDRDRNECGGGRGHKREFSARNVVLGNVPYMLRMTTLHTQVSMVVAVAVMVDMGRKCGLKNILRVEC